LLHSQLSDTQAELAKVKEEAEAKIKSMMEEVEKWKAEATAARDHTERAQQSRPANLSPPLPTAKPAPAPDVQQSQTSSNSASLQAQQERQKRAAEARTQMTQTVEQVDADTADNSGDADHF